MKTNPPKRICTFTFQNGTELRAAVPFLDGKGNRRPYDEIFAIATQLCWTGDEDYGRGGLVKFEIGGVIST